MLYTFKFSTANTLKQTFPFNYLKVLIKLDCLFYSTNLFFPSSIHNYYTIFYTYDRFPVHSVIRVGLNSSMRGNFL